MDTMNDQNPKSRQSLSDQEKQQIRALLRFLGVVLVCIIAASLIAGLVASMIQSVG